MMSQVNQCVFILSFAGQKKAPVKNKKASAEVSDVESLASSLGRLIDYFFFSFVPLTMICQYTN